MTSALATMDLTAAQGHIMGFLSHAKNAPCSRDIEEAFHLSHPTVSGLLSRMESKGFIEFRPDGQDRRIKRIHLLEKGRQCSADIRQTILANEQRLVAGFTETEKEQFYQYLTRACANMGCGTCCKGGNKNK